MNARSAFRLAARTGSLVAVAFVAAAPSACHDDPACRADDSCFLPSDHVDSCTPIGRGIHGTVKHRCCRTCSRNPCGPGSDTLTETACGINDGEYADVHTFVATGSSGRFEFRATRGIYFVSLETGRYDVCPIDRLAGCVTVQVGAYVSPRIDIFDDTLDAHDAAIGCNPLSDVPTCGPLGCAMAGGQSDPVRGECVPPVIQPLGGSCDANPTAPRRCGEGAVCTNFGDTPEDEGRCAPRDP